MNHLYTREANRAIQETKKFLKGVVEQPHPVFAGLPPCPFARKERIEKKIKWHCQRINPDDVDERLLQILIDFSEQNEKNSLLLLDPFSKIGYKELERFARHFKKIVKELNLSAIAFHPDHPFTIGGVKTRQSPYPMINIGLDKEFHRGYTILRKTDYYSGWKLEELSKINREKEFKDG